MWVLVYDSECLICNKFILFVSNKDKQKSIKFASFKSKFYNNHKMIDKSINTIVYVKSLGH